MEDESDPELALAASLDGLAKLVTRPKALESTLEQIAQYAVAATPGADGAGLTLIEVDRPPTVVGTADFVRAVDDIQYGLNEGPCVSAVAEARTFVSGNLGGERYWPRFGPRVGRLGVHSALSVPLHSPQRVVIGALNIYARGRDVFHSRAVTMAEAFAPQAAVSVVNAQMLAQAERLVGRLQEALTSRAEIDQAIGILMSRGGISAEEAMTRLRAMSQSRSVRVSEIARQLLSDAVRRAQARRASSPEAVDPP
jgi:GAF domain-containing protein